MGHIQSLHELAHRLQGAVDLPNATKIRMTGAEYDTPYFRNVHQMSQSVQTEREHLDFLDGVRGLAALYVVVHHAIVHLPMPLTLSPTEWLLRKFGGFGHYAVDVFIVLSGYCLMLPVARGKRLELLQFYLRRALRILPAYLLAGALSLALISTLLGTPSGTLWDHSIPVTGFDLLAHLAMIHDWFPSSANKINHVFWSVGVEWKIYFLFPLLLAGRTRLGLPLTAGLAIVTSYVLWLICYWAEILNPGPWGSSFYYLGLFALGMLAAEQGERWASASISRSKDYLLGCFSLLTIGIAVLSYYSDERIPLQVQSLPVGVWAALLLFMLRVRAAPRPICSLFASPAATWLGRMGYSLYLTHAPVLQLVYLYVIGRLTPRPDQVPLMVLLGTPAAILLASVFFRIAEQPFHRLSRHVRKLPMNAVPSTMPPELPAVAQAATRVAR